ncbi:S-adenosyl-L-methionine-dependent methyltransferase [Hyaloraphidium curvatum]|nr:S-adenosyl-L-methionine-dependent methyltransferase [Hyaloraphidium curvatum]
MSAPAKSYSLWDSSFNWIWKRMGPDVDRKLAPWKKRVYGDVTGNILEIGAGHGATFAYMDPSKISHVTALEPNEAMHELLRANAAKAGFEEGKGNLAVVSEPAEVSAPPPDGAQHAEGEAARFDAVLSSLVLCTVADPPAVLRNVHAWLKDGGQFRFLEHMGDAAGTRRRWWQESLTPVWKYIGHGCHLDRDHAEMVRTLEEGGKRLFGRVELEEIDPLEETVDGMWIARPLIFGTAWKQ